MTKKFNYYLDTNYIIKLLHTVYVKIIEILIKQNQNDFSSNLYNELQ